MFILSNLLKPNSNKNGFNKRRRMTHRDSEIELWPHLRANV